MTTQTTYSAREARAVCTEHPAWPDYRRMHGLNAATARMADFEAFAETARIDLETETRKARAAKTSGMFDDVENAETVETVDDKPAAALDDMTDDERLLWEMIQRRKEQERQRAAAASSLDESRVVALIREHAPRPAHVKIEIVRPDAPKTEGETVAHHRFPLLLAAIGAGVNVMLVGPAGSGKTTAAAKVAEALGREFLFTGAVSQEFKLSGFVDAQGRVVSTAFRRAYESGGVFLFDEMDASAPAAVLAFNAALAGDLADFPGGMVRRHEQFAAIAACNTFGRGADRVYVGRTQQDAAALDRYAVLDWDYDAGLEAAIMGLPRPSDAPRMALVRPIKDPADQREAAGGWLETVRRYRDAIEKTKTRLVVSPRATQHGWRLLCAGWPENAVMDACIWKGLDADARAKVTEAVAA